MSVRLNHTIVWCRDKQASAQFLIDILGLSRPKIFGPFLVVELGNDVSLDFHEQEGEHRAAALCLPAFRGGVRRSFRPNS